jgi:hypothetical protein
MLYDTLELRFGRRIDCLQEQRQDWRVGKLDDRVAV